MNDEIYTNGNQALMTLINSKVDEVKNSAAFVECTRDAKRARLNYAAAAVIFSTLSICVLGFSETATFSDGQLVVYSLGVWVPMVIAGLFFAACQTAHKRIKSALDELIDSRFLAEIDSLRESGHVIDRRILSAIANALKAGKPLTYGEVLRLAETYKPLSDDAQAFAEKFASNSKAGQ